ncbi:MAG: ABC transporter substrate-binding protein [Deltaproteobacteria bacterium]|nr:ABC transporter substrate-binding protein [Deltaproteobacteria bacterium]
MIFLSARGTSVKVVYVTDYSDSVDVIPASSTAETPADLKGKVIGFEGLNSFSHIFVLDFIKPNGIKETDATGKHIIKHCYSTGQVGPGIKLGRILDGSFVLGAKIGNNP